MLEKLETVTYNKLLIMNFTGQKHTCELSYTFILTELFLSWYKRQ